MDKQSGKIFEILREHGHSEPDAGRNSPEMSYYRLVNQVLSEAHRRLLHIENTYRDKLEPADDDCTNIDHECGFNLHPHSSMESHTKSES